MSHLLVAMAACGPAVDPPLAEVDLDGDGLSDNAELELGTELDDPDTDGDGLVDGDEIANGADPFIRDTDGDGYTDRDEVFEGKDPNDDQSVIYSGGWPYYFEKTELRGGSFTDAIGVGKRFARVKLADQHGEQVDLFDFYNDRKPVVIDLSAQWCLPCQQLSTFVVGDGDPLNYGDIWPAGPAVVRRGDVYWITIIGEGLDRLPATQRTAEEWADEYPSRQIPVLAEGDYDTYEYATGGEDINLPVVVLLDPGLLTTVWDLTGPTALLTELDRQFPE
jgi:hypothetical protein